jgi:hypothetical protein
VITRIGGNDLVDLGKGRNEYAEELLEEGARQRMRQIDTLFAVKKVGYLEMRR